MEIMAHHGLVFECSLSWHLCCVVRHGTPAIGSKMDTWTYLWAYCWSMFQSNGLLGLGRFLKAFCKAINTRALNKRSPVFLVLCL